MNPLAIHNYTLTTTCGSGRAENLQALKALRTGLSPCTFHDIQDLSTWAGEIKDVEQISLPAELQKYACRNNKLALLGLEQDGFTESAQRVINKYGANRVATFIGTSTSGIYQTEQAYFASPDLKKLPDWYDYEGTQNIASVAEFVRRYLGASGPCAAISTACSSSAKVFASAYRAIQADLCDAAIVGGVDTLCLTTLYGFHSLQLVSDDICRPSDQNRNGLSIGEAAGFAVLDKDRDTAGAQLLGYGESSDAYHMSSPPPDGQGAYTAMQLALENASLTTADISYINLHGTGTIANDLAEAKAVERLFGQTIPCSSTKGWTGHTLGAAGIVEAAISLLCIENNITVPSLNTQTIDPAININICNKVTETEISYALSNSFGFGGSNCSLIFGVK